MSKKILITGGNGFIAKSIYEEYQDKYDISCLSRKELDLLDSEYVYKYIKDNSFDVVIHTATYDAAPEFSTKDPNKVLENNLKMFFNIARCSEYFGKMIYFGSGAEFGRENWTPKMKEDYFDKHIPTDQYGLSKYIMTKHTQKSNNIYNLRIFGLFGKYDDWRYRFIPNICCKAALGMPITIKQNASFDYLYIDDLLKVVEWFIVNKPKRHVYNVCSNKVNNYLSLAKKVVKVSGKDLEINLIKKELRTEYSGDSSLLLGELKDIDFKPIDESIQDLYKWYDENKHVIYRELFVY